MRYNDRSSQGLGWSLSSERDFRYQRTSTTASMDSVTPLSQLSGSVSQNSDRVTTLSARATGAVVAHDKGVTLAPYAVKDTFGIAKVGEEGEHKKAWGSRRYNVIITHIFETRTSMGD